MKTPHNVVRALAALSLVFASSCDLQDMQAPKVTKDHKRITAEAGEWVGTLTPFIPGMPSDPAPASESIVAIGKYWTQSTFRCQMAGMPYTGTGCVGYDSAKGKYVGTWIDSWSTYLSVMEGRYDEKLGALIMRWQAPDEKGKMQWHRSVSEQKDGGRVMTFYMGEDGAEAKTMVIQMKRKSPAKASDATTRPVKKG